MFNVRISKRSNFLVQSPADGRLLSGCVWDDELRVLAALQDPQHGIAADPCNQHCLHLATFSGSSFSRFIHNRSFCHGVWWASMNVLRGLIKLQMWPISALLLECLFTEQIKSLHDRLETRLRMRHSPLWCAVFRKIVLYNCKEIVLKGVLWCLIWTCCESGFEGEGWDLRE